MKEYHKIQTMFKRELNKDSPSFNSIIPGQWSLPEFEYLSNNMWVFTEKIDGTNIRVMFNNGSVSFGGKTDNAQIPAPLVAKLNDLFYQKASLLQGDVCLYGEGYGAKIQKGGGNYSQTQEFVLFDVKIGEWWLQREDVEGIAKKFNIDVVPIIGEGTLYNAIDLVKSGIKSQWGDFIAEGIVARPKVELKSRNGSRIITKIKHRDFDTGRRNK